LYGRQKGKGGQKMKQDSQLSIVRKIMAEFADLTGLSPAREAPQRYLWIDAFAVCNFLELYRQTSDETYKKPSLAAG
jgi:hypothetical protein